MYIVGSKGTKENTQTPHFYKPIEPMPIRSLIMEIVVAT
jgi:hypothetical protein